MTDRVRLERRYRQLLACYPRAFRREHEEEMLVVLLACAHDSRRRPSIGDSVNLLWNALRLRLRPAAPSSVPSVFWGVRLTVLAGALELVACRSAGALRLERFARNLRRKGPQELRDRGFDGERQLIDRCRA
jgi:hypothetical protein